MKRLLLLTAIFLTACGPSQKEKEEIAIITCNIMGESRNMDGAVRIREINNAREKMGEDAFLGSDEDIKLSFEYGVCRELALNDLDYADKLTTAIEIELARLEAEEQKREKRKEAKAEAEKAKAEAEKAKAERVFREGVEKFIKGAVFTESGLAYRILEKGSGPKPNIDSTVEVHYVGRLLDGIEFDSSVKRGVPAQFGVTHVISGWTEVLQLMPEGSKWKVYIPAEMAYGSSGAGGVIGPNQDLIFEIELIQSNVD